MRIPSMFLETRAAPITPQNKSTAIQITSWVTLAIFVLMFLARQVSKYTVLRKVTIDDYCILLATIFAIGLTVTSLVLASQGLGVLEPLTNRRANILMKAHYASDFLYILSISFVKFSLITFFYSFYSIIAQPSERRIIQCFGIFLMAWTMASLAAVAFQCGLPKPWEMMTLHCYNTGVFWIVYCIIDMTSEVGLVMLSVNLVAYRQMSFSRKVMVVACFAPRILVIGAALARLVYLFPITPHDRPEYNLWIPTVCAQVHVCLSISTACIPYMKCFIESLEEARKKRLTSRWSHALGSASGYRKEHKRGKQMYSFDSTATLSLKYGRTPDVSPRIPSPAPLSPLTPPRYASSAASMASMRSSRSPSERGLKLQIPPPQPPRTTPSHVISPQTASSNALSPDCMSAQGLLSPPPFETSRGPSPPLRSHSPRPHALVSHHKGPNYSLFPRDNSDPIPPIPPLRISKARKKSRSPHRVSMHRMEPNTSRIRSSDGSAQQPNYPPRTSSRQPHRHRKSSPKFSTAPDPLHPSPTTTIYRSHSQASNVPKTPPMPTSIFNTPPTTSPPTFPLPQPPSPHRLRNQRVLTPQNSSHRNQMSPVSPPLSYSPGGDMSAVSPMRANRPWEEIPLDEPMPVVRNVPNRISPRIVVQRYS